MPGGSGFTPRRPGCSCGAVPAELRAACLSGAGYGLSNPVVPCPVMFASVSVSMSCHDLPGFLQLSAFYFLIS